MWEAELGIPVDSNSLSTWQNIFASGGTDTQLRVALAYSPGVTSLINSSWIRQLGVSVDPASQSYWENAFASGTTDSGLQAALAYSPGVPSVINTVYQNDLGRSIDAQSLAAYQASLAAGTISLQQEASSVAYSQESTNLITAEFQNELGRSVASSDVQTVQAALANGTQTAQGEATAIAYSQEAINLITTQFQDELGRSVAPTDIQTIQVALANGSQTISNERISIANSAEAMNDDEGIIEQTLNRSANSSDTNYISSIEQNGGSYQNAVFSIENSPEFHNNESNFILAATVPSDSTSQSLSSYQTGLASSSDPGALIIPSGLEAHTTSSNLADSNGQTIIGASGATAQLPVAFSSQFFLERGFTDNSLYAPYVAQWQRADDADNSIFTPTFAALGLKAITFNELKPSPLANFGQMVFGTCSVMMAVNPIRFTSTLPRF